MSFPNLDICPNNALCLETLGAFDPAILILLGQLLSMFIPATGYGKMLTAQCSNLSGRICTCYSMFLHSNVCKDICTEGINVCIYVCTDTYTAGQTFLNMLYFSILFSCLLYQPNVKLEKLTN